MTDISKHPILGRAYRLCHAIEKCGASEELTNASVLASDLMGGIETLVGDLDMIHAELESTQLSLQTAKDGLSYGEKVCAQLVSERDAAIQRAEKAEAQRRHDDAADTACRNLLCEERDIAEQERDEARTALAAARKALGEKDNALLTRLAEAMEKQPMGNGYDRNDWLDEFRAALNGDSHAE